MYMSVTLPKEVNYSPSLPSLPPNTTNTSVVVSPSNNTTFNQSGNVIMFDLPASGFMDPNTMYLRYQLALSQTVAPGFIRGTPAVQPFTKMEVLIGSTIVETIMNYNMVYNMVTNLQMNQAQKLGALNLGYVDANTTACTVASQTGLSLSNINGASIPWTVGTVTTTYSFALPIMNILTACDHLLPLFAMPAVRIQLTIGGPSDITYSATGVTTVASLSNLELCYDKIDFGSDVEALVRGSGDKVYLKSQGWATMSQNFTGGAGTNELIFNARYNSVKSLFCNFAGGTLAKCVNGSLDSVDITSGGLPTGGGDYQFFIAGAAYPQRSLSTSLNKYGILAELKMAMCGSINSLSAQNMSITPREFNYTDLGLVTGGNATTVTAPGKFWLGVNTEKFSTANALLSGVSTQNSPVSLRMNLAIAPAQSYNITLIALYDAILEVDFASRNCIVKQ